MAGQTPEPPPAGQRPCSSRQTEHREPAVEHWHIEHRQVEHGQREREQVVHGQVEYEHIGPVSVERHVKADGRALILYTRDAAPAA